MSESRQDCCDLTASVLCADCPQRKPDAWQIRDKHGRWITLPGDWQESENIEGREYRPLYALPASREAINEKAQRDCSGWSTMELMVPNLGWCGRATRCRQPARHICCAEPNTEGLRQWTGELSNWTWLAS